MSLWRREALARFPELRREIADGGGIFCDLWPLLRHSLLLPAYEAEPPDLATAARVFDFAAWCGAHRSPHVRLAVADEFYERLADDREDAGGNAALAVSKRVRPPGLCVDDVHDGRALRRAAARVLRKPTKA